MIPFQFAAVFYCIGSGGSIESKDSWMWVSTSPGSPPRYDFPIQGVGHSISWGERKRR